MDVLLKQSKMTNSYHIIDPLNIIKNKSYLEKWLEENKFKKESFLNEQVEYEKDVTQKYTFVTKNMNSTTKQYEIQFYETRPLSKHAQFKKRLEDMRLIRENSTSNEDKMKDAWSLYRQILNFEPIQKLEKNIVDMAVPPPTQIIQHKEMYKRQVESIPDSILRKYFDKCLEIDTKN